jgi:transcriptional regulator with XRE-family HTH domain
MVVGNRIQSLRKAQEKSLRSLAAEADISVAYLVKIEKGESSPTIEVIQRIADALKIPVKEITGAVDESSSRQLPASLRNFIEKYRGSIPELADPDWQRALADVKLRGQYPKETDDWLPIFASMRQALDGSA